MKVPPIRLKKVKELGPNLFEWEVKLKKKGHKYKKSKVLKQKLKKKDGRRTYLFHQSFSQKSHLLVPKLFQEIKPLESHWIKLTKSDYQSAVSLLKPSINIKVETSTSKGNWKNLKCFEGIVDGVSGITLFAGGPISCSAFCPLANDEEIDQYVALAVSNIEGERHSSSCGESSCGFIQIWDVGKLKKKDISCEVKMVFGICHHHGAINDMRWCPQAINYQTSQELQESDVYARLGLLAVACQDSSIRIYSIPHPLSFCKSNGTYLLYNCNPSFILQPSFGVATSHMKSMCCCIAWQETDKCERVAGGFGNGLICIWFLKVSSTDKNDQQILLPYLTFLAHGSPVTSISLAPLSGCRWLLSSGLDFSMKCYDLMDTSIPFHCTKLGMMCSFKWAAEFCAAFMCPQDGVFDKGSTFMREFGTEAYALQQIPTSLQIITHSSFSDSLNAVAMTDMTGTVSISFFKVSFLRHTKLSLTKSYTLFETTISPSSGSESTSNTLCMSEQLNKCSKPSSVKNDYSHDEMVSQCSSLLACKDSVIKTLSQKPPSQNCKESSVENNCNDCDNSQLQAKTLTDFQILTVNKSGHFQPKRKYIEIPTNILISNQAFEGNSELNVETSIEATKRVSDSCLSSLRNSSKKRNIGKDNTSDYPCLDCNNNINPDKSSTISYMDDNGEVLSCLEHPGQCENHCNNKCSFSSDDTISYAYDTDSSSATVVYDDDNLEIRRDSKRELRTSAQSFDVSPFSTAVCSSVTSNGFVSKCDFINGSISDVTSDNDSNYSSMGTLSNPLETPLICKTLSVGQLPSLNISSSPKIISNFSQSLLEASTLPFTENKSNCLSRTTTSDVHQVSLESRTLPLIKNHSLCSTLEATSNLSKVSLESKNLAETNSKFSSSKDSSSLSRALLESLTLLLDETNTNCSSLISSNLFQSEFKSSFVPSIENGYHRSSSEVSPSSSQAPLTSTPLPTAVDDSYCSKITDISQKFAAFQIQNGLLPMPNNTESVEDETSCSTLSSTSLQGSRESPAQLEDISPPIQCSSENELSESKFRTFKSDACNKKCSCSTREFLNLKSLPTNPGIIFKDVNQVEKPSLTENSPDPTRYFPDELGFLSTITSISWNPNPGYQSWLLTAGNAGVVRIVRLPDSVTNQNR